MRGEVRFWLCPAELVVSRSASDRRIDLSVWWASAEADAHHLATPLTTICA